MEDELIALLPRLRRFAVGLAGSVQDGDDLVQAACERALSRSYQFRPGTRLDSWTFRIIHSLWCDKRRYERARPHQPLETAEGSASVDPEIRLQQRFTLDRVRRAVAGLTTDHRAVLLLVCVEGFTYKEAAETLGVPVGTVMSRLARARSALARVLEGGDAPSAPNIVPLGKSRT